MIFFFEIIYIMKIWKSPVPNHKVSVLPKPWMILLQNRNCRNITFMDIYFYDVCLFNLKSVGKLSYNANFQSNSRQLTNVYNVWIEKAEKTLNKANFFSMKKILPFSTEINVNHMPWKLLFKACVYI